MNLSHLELFISESGVDIVWLSVRCQELERDCERIIAKFNVSEMMQGGMLDLLETSCTTAAEDREALRVLLKKDVRSALR